MSRRGKFIETVQSRGYPGLGGRENGELVFSGYSFNLRWWKALEMHWHTPVKMPQRYFPGEWLEGGCLARESGIRNQGIRMRSLNCTTWHRRPDAFDPLLSTWRSFLFCSCRWHSFQPGSRSTWSNHTSRSFPPCSVLKETTVFFAFTSLFTLRCSEHIVVVLWKCWAKLNWILFICSVTVLIMNLTCYWRNSLGLKDRSWIN